MAETEESRWFRIRKVVARALELSPDDREAFVLTACNGDTQLASEVAALVDRMTGGGTGTGPDAMLRNVEGVVADAINELVHDSLGLSDDQLEDRIGSMVGPFRLVREAGRGGMSVVYVADRDDGQFEQHVALKILKKGMDTDEVVKRFKVERKILASLDHPNIARLFGGGLTDDGLPYFTMEFVDGLPINRYCDQHRLTIEERLGIFTDACEAVAYAHQHHVVHRDIKPSNLFVSSAGQVKLMDFGISKLLTGDERDRTVTVTRRFTPAYAAPELVIGGPITVATDVYSLGVVLHELLTGRLPFRRVGHDAAASELGLLPEELQQPSRVVEPGLAVAAQRRLHSNDELRRRLRGDLDAIATVALSTQPTDRYESAKLFLDDITAHLTKRPIGARPPTVVYRAKKYAQRNAVLVSLSALALLIAALAFTTYQTERNIVRRLTVEYGGLPEPLRTPVMVPGGFSVSRFYDIVGADGIAIVGEDELVVVKEWPAASAGVYRARRGASWQLGDRIDEGGNNLYNPDDVLIGPDGMVYVADGQGRVVNRIPLEGGAREGFAHSGTSDTDTFNPFGLAIAPASFDGPNVDPGDLIVADNAYGLEPAVWAINLETGLVKMLADFGATDGALTLGFTSNGTLFVGTNGPPFTIHVVSSDGELTNFLDGLEDGSRFAIHPQTDEVFFSLKRGKIHRVSSRGGTPVLFADNVGRYQDQTFSSDGTKLYVSAINRQQVIEISAPAEYWRFEDQ